MLEEAAVLGGQEGLHQAGGDLGVGDGPSAFRAEFGHQGAISAEDPHGLLKLDLPQGVGAGQVRQAGGDQDPRRQQAHRRQVESQGDQGGEHETEARQGAASTPP